MQFDKDAIKMGTTILTLSESEAYIEWADSVISIVIDANVKKGRLKGVALGE